MKKIRTDESLNNDSYGGAGMFDNSDLRRKSQASSWIVDDVDLVS